jgi:23S rRNA U2552 (ribose-2'-O)-methylase RlmE/FtsJ
MATKVLKGGGHALIKLFQWPGFQELVGGVRGRFAKVKLVKRTASRARRS